MADETESQDISVDNERDENWEIIIPEEITPVRRAPDWEDKLEPAVRRISIDEELTVPSQRRKLTANSLLLIAQAQAQIESSLPAANAPQAAMVMRCVSDVMERLTSNDEIKAVGINFKNLRKAKAILVLQEETP